MGGVSGWWGGGDRVDVNERIEVFVKIQKNIFFGGGGLGRGGRGGSGRSGWGVRVDVNEELKFLGKFTKKNQGGGVGMWGVMWGGGSGWWGGGQGGCERRIEVFVNLN